MTYYQMTLFDDPAINVLRAEVHSIKTSGHKVRKSVFAKHSKLEKRQELLEAKLEAKLDAMQDCMERIEKHLKEKNEENNSSSDNDVKLIIL